MSNIPVSTCVTGVTTTVVPGMFYLVLALDLFNQLTRFLFSIDREVFQQNSYFTNQDKKYLMINLLMLVIHICLCC